MAAFTLFFTLFFLKIINLWTIERRSNFPLLAYLIFVVNKPNLQTVSIWDPTRVPSCGAQAGLQHEEICLLNRRTLEIELLNQGGRCNEGPTWGVRRCKLARHFALSARIPYTHLGWTCHVIVAFSLITTKLQLCQTELHPGWGGGGGGQRLFYGRILQKSK